MTIVVRHALGRRNIRMNVKFNKRGTMFHKFTLVILTVGLFPVFLLAVFISYTMLSRYEVAVKTNYEQAAVHISTNLDNILDNYNTISKMIYSYSSLMEGSQTINYLKADTFRQVIEEENRSEKISAFLRNVQTVDSYIYATHFIGFDSHHQKLAYHYSMTSTYFKDEEIFESDVDYTNWDKESKKLQVVPTHKNKYFNGPERDIITFARNYFDIRGVIGKGKYIGTIFIDVDIDRLRMLLQTVNVIGEGTYYIVNEAGDCMFSNDENIIGENLYDKKLNLQNTKEQLSIASDADEYGLKVIIIMDKKTAFMQITVLQKMLFFAVLFCIVLLAMGSIWFSKKLTNPINKMVDSMELIENGNFELQLPVTSNDEIGILSARFNQMLTTLNQYINQCYVAKIKQNEAELTAVKSQIYPHFLYNTLEVIRMTALDNKDEKVSKMIQALSLQMRYIIGNVNDFVPLSEEIEIVKNYVYLLNCRIDGGFEFHIHAPDSKEIMVPKLILQPIVENAYKHGLKPKGGKGNVILEVERKNGMVQITIMDNGVGMDEIHLKQLNKNLEGNEMGVKNAYNWQSIGVKNVHDRIRYIYGEGYGVEITSSQSVGTMVQIFFPDKGGSVHAKDDHC